MRHYLEYLRGARKQRLATPTSTGTEQEVNLYLEEPPAYTDLFGDPDNLSEPSKVQVLEKSSERLPEIYSDVPLKVSMQENNEDIEEYTEKLGTSISRTQTDGCPLERLAAECHGCRAKIRPTDAYNADKVVPCTNFLHRIIRKRKVDLESALIFSLKHVKKVNPDAAQLFLFFAYFHFLDLSYSLIAAADVLQTTWVSRVTSSPAVYDQVMRCLRKHSLIEFSNDTYRIEPTIHDWISQTLNNGPLFSTFIMALRCVANSHSPITTINNQSSSNRFVQHAEHLMHSKFERMWDFAMQDPNYIELIISLARCYQRWDQPDKASSLSDSIMKARHQNHPPALSLTATAMSNLAKTLAKQGQKTEAEQLYLQALNVFDADPNQDPTLRLKTLRRLGCLYGTLSRLDEAEPILKKVLNLSLTAPPETRNISKIVRAYADLGYLRHEQRRFAEALSSYRLALDEYGSILGQEDRNIFLVHLRQGDTYHRLNEFEKAEEAYDRALKGYNSKYGRNQDKIKPLVQYLESMRRGRESGEETSGVLYEYGEWAYLRRKQPVPTLRSWAVTAVSDTWNRGENWCGYMEMTCKGMGRRPSVPEVPEIPRFRSCEDRDCD